MKNTKRQAFTIVELVIVIAVIAILSAVLIPTFGAIIKDANIAADQATASTLTSELQVYLKGETIDSEEELMAALSDPNLGFTDAKLTPKAAAYGIHFWFDMSTQMIVAKTATEIQELGTSRAAVASAKQEGPVLASAVTIADTPSANISFRDFYGFGIYLIDRAGSRIADLFNDIDNLTDEEDYNAMTASLDTLVRNSASEEKEYAEALVSAVKTSAIITENYVKVPSGATRVYFESGIQFVNNNGSLEGFADGTVITLPSTVVSVSTGALDFGTSNITLVTSCNDAIDVERIFANGSTNAVIKTAAADYKIAADDDSKLVINGETTHIEGITLSGKLPYDNFSLLLKDDGSDSVAFVNTDAVNGGVVNYGYYAGTDKKIQLYLNGDGSEAKASSDLISWTSASEHVTINGGLMTISADADGEIEITASARVLDGSRVERKMTVYINKINKATVKAGSASFTVGGATAPTFVWNFVGTEGITFSASSINANYDYPYATCKGTPTVSLSVENNTYFTADKDVLKLVMADGVPAANGKTAPVTINLDNCFTSTVNVNVVDNSAAVFTPNFRYNNYKADENGAYRRYYVGNGSPVMLSDILKGTFEKSTLTINGYAVYGLSYPINSEAYEGELSVKIDGEEKYSLIISDEDAWNATELQFTGSSDLPIIIEVRPDDADKVPSVIEIVIVNGVNVKTAGELVNALNGGQSAIMLSDVTIADSTTHLEVGNNALYGNGYRIDAKNYKPGKVNDKYIGDNYLIKVDTKGLVENIYLDGPVYTTLQYHKEDAYLENGNYVAGIKAIGNATISNSYASGFRNPIQISGTTSGEGATTVTLDNVTLEGGNLCNLSIVSGNAKLNNVTTIQKPVTSDGKTIIGAGILVEEKDALASDITITGKFVQHNWVNKDDAGKLPTVKVHGKEINLGELAPAAYLLDDATSLMTTVGTGDDAVPYLNTGIIYIATEKKVNGVSTLKESDLDNAFIDNTSNAQLFGKKTSVDEVKDKLDKKSEQYGKIASMKPWDAGYNYKESLAAGVKWGVMKLAQAVVNGMVGDINAVIYVNTYKAGVTPPVMPNVNYSGYYSTGAYASYNHN